jgi:site-specific recombinase XerD
MFSSRTSELDLGYTGAKRLGVRIANWLTVDQSKTLLRESPLHSLRGKRDRAILALLIGLRL